MKVRQGLWMIVCHRKTERHRHALALATTRAHIINILAYLIWNSSVWESVNGSVYSNDKLLKMEFHSEKSVITCAITFDSLNGFSCSVACEYDSLENWQWVCFGKEKCLCHFRGNSTSHISTEESSSNRCFDGARKCTRCSEFTCVCSMHCWPIDAFSSALKSIWIYDEFRGRSRLKVMHVTRMIDLFQSLKQSFQNSSKWKLQFC